MTTQTQAISLAGLLPDSRVNGPGRRVVLWAQGCDLGCPGCFNPATHAKSGGRDWTRAALCDAILAAKSPYTAGLTLSGGEPFQQAAALAPLLAEVRAAWPEATFMAFSGYRLESLRATDAPSGAAALLAQLDYLVDGRFEARRLGRRIWRGSTNQRLWVLGRPLPRSALAEPPDVELHVEADGRVLLSGFPDARLVRSIRALDL